jgi:hypothetical protein
MGVLTDLFVASPEELRRTFPYRVPVCPEPTIRMTRNPFTGQEMPAKQWMPAESFPENLPGAEVRSAHERDGFRLLPNWEYKGLDPLLLAALWTQLRGGDLFEYSNTISRPALLSPEEEDLVSQIPSDLVSALAELPASQMVASAAEWSSSEEFQISNWTAADGREVLEALCSLARLATTEKKGLYLWVSL